MKTKKENIEARALGYLILKEILSKKPTEAFLQKCAKEKVFSVFPYREYNSEIKKAADAIDYAICWADDKDIENMREDYENMFVINTDRNVYQWESAHRSEERVIMGKNVLSFNAFLNRYGLEPSAKNQPPDSIGNEFEFMYITSAKALSDKNENVINWILKDQESFYNLHLDVWVESFLKILRLKARTEFYKQSALLTAAFLQTDKNELLKCLYGIKSGKPFRKRIGMPPDTKSYGNGADTFILKRAQSLK